MISVFNGRCRGLGQQPASRVYVQIDVAFRDVLYHLKGARLAVLLAIALHANEDGWAWPSYEQISRETGYDLHTIRNALADLCRLEINGQRVLLRFQPSGSRGRFESNRYLIFPSPEEIARYEGSGVRHPGARSGGGFDRRAVFARRSPSCSFPTTENCTTNNNQSKPEPDNNYQDEEEEEKNNDTADKIAEIARALQENGVFPENAFKIATRMAEADLTAKEALDVYLATLRQVTEQNVPDEQAIGRAVYRLEQGIWDAGARAREAIRRAQRGGPAKPSRLVEPNTETDATPLLPAQKDVWQKTLENLRLRLTRATFETWLAGSRLIAREDGVFVIGVASTYARDWLESRLLGVIESALAQVVGQPVQVRFVVDG